MQIVFTIEQLNQLLNGLGELPFKQASGFIEFIKNIAEPQVAVQQQPVDTDNQQTTTE